MNRSKRHKCFAIIILVAGFIMAFALNLMLGGCYGPNKTIKDKIRAAEATKQQYYNADGMPVDVPVLPKQSITERLLTSNDAQVITKTVRSTDWLMTLFIMVSVLGVIAGLHGLKSGWIVVVGCIAGAGMKAAFSIASTYILSGLIFVGVILAVMVIVMIRSMKAKVNLGAKFQDAFKDVVGTVQAAKDRISDMASGSGSGLISQNLGVALDTLKNTLGKQKPETRQLVDVMKKEIHADKIVEFAHAAVMSHTNVSVPVDVDPDATVLDAVMGNVPGATVIQAANGDVVVNKPTQLPVDSLGRLSRDWTEG